MIEELDRRVALGLLRRAEHEAFVLYNYTDKCVWEKAWDDYTLQARGLIIDKTTGQVVARPFRKFFNLGEHEQTHYNALPKEPYEVFEKYDGSLGVLYWMNGAPFLATRGSFASDQAREGTKILRTLNWTALPRGVTCLFEIIYPENRICPGARLVVDYGEARKLVLLGAFEIDSNYEYAHDELEAIADNVGCDVAKKHTHTIDEMIALQKTLPREREGFVVRFSSGLRVKIKGEEYLRFQKIINTLSPLSVWEVMQNGSVPVAYYQGLPEELHPEVRGIEDELARQYGRIRYEIDRDFEKLPAGEVTRELRKEIGLLLSHCPERFNHPSAMFPLLRGKPEVVDKYIKDLIRPRNNVIGAT